MKNSSLKSSESQTRECQKSSADRHGLIEPLSEQLFCLFLFCFLFDLGFRHKELRWRIAPFSGTFGLVYSSVNSANLSFLTEVTLRAMNRAENSEQDKC